MQKLHHATHRRQKASKYSEHEIQTKRIPADFGWEFLSLLLGSLHPYLASSVRNKCLVALRKRDIGAYLLIGEQESAQWTSDILLVGGPLKAASNYLVAKVLSKCVGMEVLGPQEMREQTLDSVFELDRELSPNIFLTPSDPVLKQAQYWVRFLMGDPPNVTEIAESARHGPGSTATTGYRDRSTYFKYANWPYAVSSGCRDLFKRMILLDERWLGSLEQSYRLKFNIPAWSILDWDLFWSRVLVDQNWNVVTSVPKNGLKQRPIAKEPLGNVFCQLGLGSILKRRLGECGIDLTDQSKNRRLARLASTLNSDLSPCTVDLSSASDTISLSLVQYLVSPGWFSLLHSTRSEYGLYPGRFSWRYAKMSSMGNATTFELESTIFASVIWAVISIFGEQEDRAYTSVFGDDLIFPRYLYLTITHYLEAFGFKVNNSKSFQNGTFFESCGSDWNCGVNIRPMFLRKIPETIQDLMVAHNQINIWFLRNFGCWAPSHISSFFRQYAYCVPTGPLHCDTMDSWFFQKGKDRGGQCVRSIVSPCTHGDFWFRKLMHNLRSCESDTGSRFTISRRSRLKWFRRAPLPTDDPNLGVIGSDGVLQNLDWPSWEEISCE